MKNAQLYLLFCFCLVVCSLPSQSQCLIDPLTPTDVVFVKELGSGDFTGTSWDNALDGRLLAKYLREKAVAGTAIYVAAGNYYTCNPACGDTARTRFFELNHHISLKGGYRATSTEKDTSDANRDMKANVTRLSAEYQHDGDRTNNSYHVVFIKREIGVTFGGFYISDGYAFPNAGNNSENGGGIFCDGRANPLDQNIVFFGHLIIENNTANFGGGIYFNQRIASIADNIIVRNNVSINGNNGAGIFAWGDFALFNSTISGNTGNAIVSWKGDIALRNSTITDNTGIGISVTNVPSLLKLRLRIISSTITDNGGIGIKMDNHLLDSMTINLDNSLIINNVSNGSLLAQNLLSSGAFPVDIVGYKHTIIGDSIFKNNREDQFLLPIPVALGVQAQNGGWGDTRALLDVCNNPAVGAGDISLLSDTVHLGDTIYVGAYTNVDQRGVARDNPPCIGAYDGVRLQKTTTWTGTINEDWNIVSNWNNGVPLPCSYVTIPKGLSRYPIIDNTTNAVCDTIDFDPGAEIGGVPYLTYNYAKSKLEIQSNRWYTLSAPLTDLYSGDFILSPNRRDPVVYMMKYQSTHPQTGAEKTVGEWTNPFNTLSVPLSVGMGYAVWVDHEPTGDVVFDFPKTTTRYYYFDVNGNQLSRFVDLSRTNPGKFTFNDLMDVNKQFTVPVDNASVTEYNSLIIGNPFMSHLNFVAFHAANSSLIENKFQVWKGGTSFESYLIVGGNVQVGTDSDGGVDGLQIPPMQSFLVTKLQNFTDVTFTPLMSVTQPGVGLRSNSSNTEENTLKLAISQGEERLSGSVIRLRKGASNTYRPSEDVWTAFPNKNINTCIIYSLTGGGASSINTLDDAPVLVELGLRNKIAGKLRLNMTGLDNFTSSYSVYLGDRKLQTKQNLRENPVYELTADTGTIHQRLYLSIEKQLTGMEKLNDEETLVSAFNQELHITSPLEDPVQGVEIVDLQGRVLARYAGQNQSRLSISLDDQFKQKLLIVRVHTKNTCTVHKIVL